MSDDFEIVRRASVVAGGRPATELVATGEIPNLMLQIRPQWQAKGLIERVRRLLPVDPSSACQRLFNAAVQDLREKVQMAGLDIAQEAAKTYRLPTVAGQDSIEEYSTAKLIDLAYRMGLLTRPEWRKMTRVYDIRRDLEHEDSEYEAGIEDCIYIFTTCIDAVLSRDPVQPLRVAEVKEIVQAAGPALPTAQLIEDFKSAPDTRQAEILKFLVGTALALNGVAPDVVRENAFATLKELNSATRDSVRIELAAYLQEKVGRKKLEPVEVRVATAIGILTYLNKGQRIEFFRTRCEELIAIGHDWRSHAEHGGPLRSITEYGGLGAAPDPVHENMTKWMALCYIGEEGGYGAGRRRPVFFSNSAAPIIEELFKNDRARVGSALERLQSNPDIVEACKYGPTARRYQDLLDLTTT
ncbi:hypothetical protein [Fodinicola acaciae]|uniref:hypothetical protein n=1 Tax=Fodinicola acaciae TaxID=2681555 RepID=UPI0013D7BFE2|nr:hypothetical protein [Fodinicola acaciae]